MRKLLVLLLLNMVVFSVSAQKIDQIINAKEVLRIESVLASDEMQGRKTFTPGIDKAAAFIAEEFAKMKIAH